MKRQLQSVLLSNQTQWENYVHNMSLKSKNLHQKATDIFISKVEKEQSLWDVIYEWYKKHDTKNVFKYCLIS